MDISKIEIQYSNQIKELRYNNKIEEAIAICNKAIEEYPSNNFFYKVKGDMYLQINDIRSAALSYLQYLKLIRDNQTLLRNFARFYTRFNKLSDVEDKRWYISFIRQAIQSGEVSETIATMIGAPELLNKDVRDFLDLCKDDKNLSIITGILKEDKDDFLLKAVLSDKINTDINENCNMINGYIVSVAEKRDLIPLAIELSKRMIQYSDVKNPTLIRTLFRLCRKRNDYSDIETFININEYFVEKSDFNIQYELVYYFEYTNNQDLLFLTLKHMRHSASRSIPIARTLYNFYLKFGLLDEAKELSGHIAHLLITKKESLQQSRITEQIESEEGAWTKIRELVTDQEHNRQMLALRDLLKGFSHELGQPVTNIRYAIQLFQMKAERGKLSENSIDDTLSSILKQTDRIHALLSRFRPIVSSKSSVSTFNVYNRILDVFSNLSERLEKSNICYVCNGEQNYELTGDAVQFDQIFYNLILNSMQAIEILQESNAEYNGEITVNLNKKKNGKLIITACDNGPGVLFEYHKKIFEPFFTTKELSDKSEGGEGLGLFIVWNVLKMFNGTIRLDEKYTNGARFIIEI